MNNLTDIQMQRHKKVHKSSKSAFKRGLKSFSQPQLLATLNCYRPLLLALKKSETDKRGKEARCQWPWKREKSLKRNAQAGCENGGITDRKLPEGDWKAAAADGPQHSAA